MDAKRECTLDSMPYTSRSRRSTSSSSSSISGTSSSSRSRTRTWTTSSNRSRSRSSSRSRRRKQEAGSRSCSCCCIVDDDDHDHDHDHDHDDVNDVYDDDDVAVGIVVNRLCAMHHLCVLIQCECRMLGFAVPQFGVYIIPAFPARHCSDTPRPQFQRNCSLSCSVCVCELAGRYVVIRKPYTLNRT